jgi:hypothetical protein
MKRFSIRLLKYLGIFIGFLIVLLVAGTLIVNYYYRDKLIAYAIEQINLQTDARINIGKVDFSIWRRFPSASIWLKNVYVQSSNQFKKANGITGNDTLLLAREVFLEFDMLELFHGAYELKRLYVNDGYVNLTFDKRGKANYEILKHSDKPVGGDFNLQLKDLVLSDTYIKYNDLRSKFIFRGKIRDMGVRGSFQTREKTLRIKAHVFINTISSGDECFVVDKAAKFSTNLFLNDFSVIFSDALVSTESLNFSAKAEFDTGEKPYMKLDVLGNNLNIKDLMSILPRKVQKLLVNYSISGKTSLKLAVKGGIGNNELPGIVLQFKVFDASASQNASAVKLQEISFDGYYASKLGQNQETLLKINHFKSALGSGEINGDFSVENISHPTIVAAVQTKLDLNEVKGFFGIDTLQIFSGKMEGKVSATGSLPSFSAFKMSELKNFDLSGQVKLSDVEIELKRSEYHVQQVNGMIAFNNDIELKDLKLVVHNNDFAINGTLSNGIQYFFKQREDVVLKADVSSQNLDLSRYFITDPNSATKGYSRELLFPENINIDVKLNVTKFKLNKFNAKWVSCYVNYKPKMFVLKSLKFESMGGKVSGNGAVLQDYDKNFNIRGQLDVTRLNLPQLFTTFGNFSQDIVQEKNLRGDLSGKITFSSEWNNLLVLNKDLLVVESDVTINNGQLVNFGPLNSLSRFISVEELKDVKFSTLKNHIYIKDKKIIIPQMDIASSAFNITASGTHYFDNHYSYKIRVLLSELIWGKARKAKRENDEFGYVEDDGLGKTSLYLSVDGFNNDFKIRYDSRKAVDVIKEGLTKQKKELKTIMNQEFGWFKKDTTITKARTEPKNKVKVEWDDDTKKPDEVVPDKTTEKKKAVKKEDKVKVEWE